MSEHDIRELARELKLSDAEYQHVLDALGRTPTEPEIGVIGAMWSEHCSYKSSRVHLRRLPTTGERVVLGPGENAGAVSLGGGLAAVFKMESHNHPSFIEPYQGAATGVGGILRDVFTMGARPLASLNSLRFGAIDHPRTPYLFDGVVGGIAGYGNCVGVPTVGGEVYFDPCYNGNILVNVFNVGVAEIDKIFLGVATGAGNPLFYVGAGTGRDGIRGAVMASDQFEEGGATDRPTVQVGDPFREKLLIEACLELMKTGAIVGIQDMGAAGLTSSSVEMASRGGGGVRINIDLVPKRERGMSAYECLLSESQERMVVVIARGREHEVGEIFARWELEWAQIGEVIEEPSFEVWERGVKVCALPVALLTDAAPAYDRPRSRPAYLDALVPAMPAPVALEAGLLALLGSPNICARRQLWERFDHQVGLGTVVVPGAADAAVLRVPGTDRAIAIALDCNSRYCHLDPRRGAQLAVAECTRNVSCTGALPLGLTDCLNFGDPTNPEVMWQLSEAIDGMAEACRALGVAVVSGNVSLYNTSSGRDIYPTPTVGVVGGFDEGLFVGEGAERRRAYCQMAFASAGDEVWLLGTTREGDLGGSEHLWLQTGALGDQPPALELEAEARLQILVRRLIRAGQLRSAHDCAEGGLGVALAESCIKGGLGIVLEHALPERPDLWLFSESASRVVVSVAAGQGAALASEALAAGVPCARLGLVSGDARVVWPGALDVALEVLTRAYEGGLDRL
jgi:phosphoribosylformylglycinamidine synthase subunit PurL